MPFPSDHTYTMAMRDTADYTALSIDPAKPFQIGADIWQARPQQYELLRWAHKTGKSVEKTSHIFGHFEKSPFPNWVEYIGPDETSSQDTSSVKFTDATLRLTTGSRLFNPRTEEIMRVTTIGTTTDTVTTLERNYGRGSSTDYLLNADLLLMLPPSFEQGFTVGAGITGDKLYKAFATGIIDWPVHMSDTQAVEKQIGGDAFMEQVDDAWVQSAHQMQSELFLGGKVVDDAGSSPEHTTEGLMNWITTNVFLTGGTISKQDIFDSIMAWQLLAKKPGIIATSKQMIYLINTFGENLVIPRQESSVLGWAVKTLRTPDGDFPLMEVDSLSEHPNLWGLMFMLPEGQIDYCHLPGMDVGYLPIQRDEVMQEEGHIYGQVGWEFWGQETFGVIKGVEF